MTHLWRHDCCDRPLHQDHAPDCPVQSDPSYDSHIFHFDTDRGEPWTP